jgi:hypothetical protein
MRIFLLCISLLSLVSIRAQHHHFLYIQSEPQQPFYVKMGSEVLSSSPEGFLIIPRLKDSGYQVVIGFPAKKFPEYSFRFAGFRKDRGMALKNFGEKGWGLFDYQTLEILMGDKIPEKEKPKASVPAPLTNDAFTVVLASVIDDPGLLATPLVQLSAHGQAPTTAPIARKETTEPSPVQKPAQPETAKSNVSLPSGHKKATDTVVKPAADQAVVKADAAPPQKVAPPLAVKEASPGKKELVDPTVVPSPTSKPEVKMASSIRRISEKQSADGLEITYLDMRAGGVGDTVQVIIPASRAMPVVQNQAKTDSLLTAAVPAGKESPVVADPVKARAVPADPAGVKAAEVIAEAPPGKAPVKEEMKLVDSAAVKAADSVEKPSGRANRSNCVRMASDKDVAAMKKKIVGIRDEDDMVSAALKDFKQRCYTTEQVKTISYVFNREEGKYKLIDAAYPYIYDPSNYGELELILKDKYFIHRFKALIQR